VHALYARSHGGERTRAATIIEEWRLVQDKMTGTYRVWRLGKDERDVTNLGPFVSEAGVRGGVHWQQTRNGITYTYAGVHEARDAVSERTWQLGVTDDAQALRLIGESVSLSAYVVEIEPPAGRHEWLFIDKNSGNVVRREAVAKNRRITTIFEDFRTFDGIPEPSRVRQIDSLGNERDLTLLSRTLDLTPDPKDVDITPTRHTLVEFPYGTTALHLPVRFVNGLPVVRVRIGLRFYDFLLDAGAAGIIVDPSVLDDAHLDTYGAHIGSTIGTFNETTSIVPALAVGSLKMHGVVVRAVSVPFRLDDRTRIAGLLGFDFFADTVVHLDIDHGTLDAYLPSAFRPPPDVTAVALALDDRTPAVRARIDGTFGRMVADTGANRSIISTAFATRADAAPDPGASVARFRSVGGTATAEAVHLKSFDLGGIAVADPVVDVSGADLGYEDVDGTAGTDLLHAYDLFFDYRSAQLYVRRTRRPPPGAS
jgi:hypothetical protein